MCCAPVHSCRNGVLHVCTSTLPKCANPLLLPLPALRPPPPGLPFPTTSPMNEDQSKEQGFPGLAATTPSSPRASTWPTRPHRPHNSLAPAVTVSVGGAELARPCRDYRRHVRAQRHLSRGRNGCGWEQERGGNRRQNTALRVGT
eukprot:343714-Chlamydomonas_euryale.AAC.1